MFYYIIAPNLSSETYLRVNICYNADRNEISLAFHIASSTGYSSPILQILPQLVLEFQFKIYFLAIE